MKLLRPFLTSFLAVSAVFALAAWGTGTRVAAEPRGNPMRIGALTITVPRGLGRYDIRGGGHMVGTRAPVVGVLATDDPGAHRSGEGFAKWSQTSSGGPPANKVALVLRKWLVIGPNPPASALRIHLPLNLRQPWFREHLTNGRRGYRWGYLRIRGQYYEVMFWSGRAGPARDRAAVVNALRSIRLTG
jgi:hypothetical protein